MNVPRDPDQEKGSHERYMNYMVKTLLQSQKKNRNPISLTFGCRRQTSGLKTP